MMYSEGRMPQHTWFVGRKLAVLFAAAAALLASGASADAALLFDNISPYENGTTGASVSATGSTPNTFMGDGYNLVAGATDITGFDLYPVNLSGTSFTGLKLNIYVWGAVNTGTVSATAPAFSNLLASYSLTSTGTFASGSFFPFESASPGATPGVTLGTPLVIPSSTIGLTFNYQGTTDRTTYANVNSLTSLIAYGVPATVGSDVFNGYYRNANSETNGDFTSTLRSLGVTNQSLAVRVYGDAVPVPEPATVGVIAATVVLAGRRRRTSIAH